MADKQNLGIEDEIFVRTGYPKRRLANHLTYYVVLGHGRQMLDKIKGLSYTINDEADLALVHLVGDLNMFSAPDLRTTLVKKFETGVKRYIFDLADLAFVDSSGIGILVSFVSMTKKTEGGKVILCGLNTQIRNIFEVTRLLSVFTVVEDLAAAREAMAA